jgi:hypothetical protein
MSQKNPHFSAGTQSTEQQHEMALANEEVDYGYNTCVEDDRCLQDSTKDVTPHGSEHDAQNSTHGHVGRDGQAASKRGAIIADEAPTRPPSTSNLFHSANREKSEPDSASFLRYSSREKTSSSSRFFLYSPVLQRQRWTNAGGSVELHSRISWGDLFLDLFYVAAAYNIRTILTTTVSSMFGKADQPSGIAWTSIIYAAAAFFPLVRTARAGVDPHSFSALSANLLSPSLRTHRWVYGISRQGMMLGLYYTMTISIIVHSPFCC